MDALIEENKQQHSRLDLPEDELKSFLFVPDVITSSKKQFYWTVPRFGSMLAYRFPVSNYLNSDSFDDYVVKLKGYKEALRDLELHQTKEERQFLEKLEEMQSKGQDTTELEEEYRSRPIETVQRLKPVFEKKEFMIVFDTLGDDNNMNQATLKELLDYSKTLKDTWEEKNLALLENDVNLYLKYMESIDSNAVSEVEKELAIEVEKQRVESEASLRETPYSPEDKTFLVNHGVLEFSFGFWKDKTRDIMENLLKLKEYNFVKYSEIFQNAFYLLKFEKHQINLPNANVFDWKKAKKIFTIEFLEDLLSYQYEGDKTDKFLDYQLTTKIIDRLNNINLGDVAAYNYPLFVFANLILITAKLRLENIRKRRIEYQTAFNQRQKALEEAKEREERLNVELEKAKQDFYSGENNARNSTGEKGPDGEEEPNEVVEFDEAEWLASWEERNPLIHIPDEPIKSIDNDIPADYVFA